MSELNETITKKFGKLFRMLGSPNEYEAHAALRKMTVLLRENGLSFNDIATVIENHQGEVEEKKYSDTDAEIIFAKGMEKGRAEEARKQHLPPEFYDADGTPRWFEIAAYCQQNSSQLRSEWERNFANDIPGKIIKYGAPREKMKPHLLSIFVQLGGKYDPKATNVYR
jgi:hypothetical protein